MQSHPVADPRGGATERAPTRPKIFSISCSFWENLTKLYVGAPPEGRRPSYGESWIHPSHQLIVIIALFILLSINVYSIPRIAVFSSRLNQSTLNQANCAYDTLHWHKIIRCAQAGHANCPTCKNNPKNTKRVKNTKSIIR